MGRKGRKEREEAALKYEQGIAETLRRRASQTIKPEALTYDTITFGTISSYSEYWIKRPNTWVNRQKTKNKDKLRLDLVRYTFGFYKCPTFLERVWLPEPHATHLTREKNSTTSKFIPWYLAVAQGKSLFKECTKGILSKKETHAFLIAPNEFTVDQNIWWARGYSESGGHIGTAGKIARSNLAVKDYKNEFWISVMRFFVRFPTNVAEMNDIMDFFVYTLRENENYSLKGRSLEAVRTSCEVWHRFLNKQKSIGGGTWEGCPIDDTSYAVGKKENQTYWTMRQIKTGNDLLKEGQAMRHCVVAYKRECMEGKNFIWSLSSKDSAGNKKRNLTIQMDKHYNIIQYRGLANRAPRPNEEHILQRWARDKDVNIHRNRFW